MSKAKQTLVSISFFLLISLLLILISCNPADNNESSIDIMADASTYTGTYPVPALFSYSDAGVTFKVTVFPGQIIAFFNKSINEIEATRIITSNGGTILEKVPLVGYYFIQTQPAQATKFITALQKNDSVALVMPNIAGYPKSKTAIFDYCDTDHGRKVLETLSSCGGTFDECVNVLQRDENSSVTKDYTSSSKVIRGILNEANENKDGSTLINLSSNGGLDNYMDFSTSSASNKEIGKYGWYKFMEGVLMTIAALPEELRKNLVITIAAGNENMPIEDILATLRERNRIADILTKNVLIVSTSMLATPGANYALNDPDVVVMNNDSAINGTSLAAPCAMGMLQSVMAEKGISAREALTLVKQASSRNKDREMLWSDVFTLIKYTGNKTTITYGPVTQQVNGQICSQTLNFDILPTLYWKSGRGTLIIPTHYHRESSGCTMAGVTKDDKTYQMLLSGSDNHIHGIGTEHILSGGVEEGTGHNGFYLSASFSGKVNDDGNISGNLTLILQTMDYVVISQFKPKITALTLTKQ